MPSNTHECIPYESAKFRIFLYSKRNNGKNALKDRYRMTGDIMMNFSHSFIFRSLRYGFTFTPRSCSVLGIVSIHLPLVPTYPMYSGVWKNLKNQMKLFYIYRGRNANFVSPHFDTLYKWSGRSTIAVETDWELIISIRLVFSQPYN